VNATEVGALAQRTAYRFHEELLIEKRGTENQRERHAAGLLPEDELLTLARDVMFAPFAGFRRWDKLRLADIRHTRACSSHGNSRDVVFATKVAPSLQASEWTMYQTIVDASYHANADRMICDLAAGNCSVQIIEHTGTCSKCGAGRYGRSASVRFQWAGRPLSREYSLEMP
jgi:hypothetical protein